MKKTSRLQLVWRVIRSTILSAATVFVMLILHNWWWVLGHYDPVSVQGSLRQYFVRCMAVTSLLVGIQFGTLFVAGLVLAIVRRRHNSVAMFFSGVLLFLLDALVQSIHFSLHIVIGWVVYVCGIPLLALALQWWPDRKSTGGPSSGDVLNASSEK